MINITIYSNKAFEALKNNGQTVKGTVNETIFSMIKELVEETKDKETLKEELIQEILEQKTDEEVLAFKEALPHWNPNRFYEREGIKFLYGGVVYETLQEHQANFFNTPDIAVSLYVDISHREPQADEETGEVTYPAWKQPLGAHDAYKRGDKVTHKGKIWENTGSDANIHEPGVSGWEVVDG